MPRLCRGRGRGRGWRRGFLGLLAIDEFKFHLRKIIRRFQQRIFKKLGQGDAPLVGKFRNQLLFLLLGQNPVPADEQIFNQVFNIHIDVGLRVDLFNEVHSLTWWLSLVAASAGTSKHPPDPVGKAKNILIGGERASHNGARRVARQMNVGFCGSREREAEATEQT